MSRRFLTPINVLHLATAPSAPVIGDLYFNTTDGILYTWDGVAWVAGSGGAGAQGTGGNAGSYGSSGTGGTGIGGNMGTGGVAVNPSTSGTVQIYY